MRSLLPAEADSLPKAAEEEVAFKVNILSKTWHICLDLTPGHHRASREVARA